MCNHLTECAKDYDNGVNVAVDADKNRQQDDFTQRMLREKGDAIAYGDSGNGSLDLASSMSGVVQIGHGSSANSGAAVKANASRTMLLSGKSLKSAAEFYNPDVPAGKDKSDQNKRAEHAKNYALVLEDMPRILQLAQIDTEPKNYEEIAQAVALAQKSVGFGSHACNGKYEKNYRYMFFNALNKTLNQGQTTFFHGVIGQSGNALDIDLDKTKLLMENGQFDSDVDELLTWFNAAKAKGTRPSNIPYDFLKKIILKGNYGLVNLLIGVANYGVDWGSKGCPEALKDKDSLRFSNDATVRNNALRSPFTRNGIGKNIDDYSGGGIGIPHFDVGNIHDLYMKFGLPENCTPEQLYTNPKTVVFSTDSPSFPVVQKGKKPESKVFDDLLKVPGWTDWAEKLVLNPEAQQFMFRHWMDKYWIPKYDQMSKVKKERLAEDGDARNVSLQNLNLSTRIGNSKKAVGTAVAGLSFQEQAHVYVDSARTDHAIRQVANVQRVNLLIEYVLEQEKNAAHEANSDATVSRKTAIETEDTQHGEWLGEQAVSSRSRPDSERRTMQAGKMVADALGALHLYPDMSHVRLLDDDRETQAVKYNAARRRRVEADIQEISRSAGRPAAGTDEHMAQTIALAQHNLGLGLNDSSQIDGKYGKNTRNAVKGGTADAPAVMHSGHATHSGTDGASDNAVGHQADFGDKQSGNENMLDLAQGTTDPLAELYEKMGLQPYSDAAFSAVVKQFGSHEDKSGAIAQLIVWSRVQRNPAIAFPIFQGGIYYDNKELIAKVQTARQEAKPAQSGSGRNPSGMPSPSDVGESETVAGAERQGGVPEGISPELLNAMLGKSNVKKTLKGEALIQAFYDGNVNRFSEEKTNLLKAYHALQMYGIQCNDVTDLMLSIAHGGDSNHVNFLNKGFLGTIFRPNANANPSLEDRYLDAKYEQDDALTQLEKVTSEGSRKRMTHLETFRDRLHGKGDAEWQNLKEGDCVIEFQASDQKVMKKDNKTLDPKKSYAEDQFRHVAVVVKLIRAQDLPYNRFKSLKVVSPRSGQDEYMKSAYQNNHRFACTMGAGENGVGINNGSWNVISADDLDWNAHRNMLWHDVDEDWCQKGISRIGSSEKADRVRKIYLFK